MWTWRFLGGCVPKINIGNSSMLDRWAVTLSNRQHLPSWNATAGQKSWPVGYAKRPSVKPVSDSRPQKKTGKMEDEPNSRLFS